MAKRGREEEMRVVKKGDMYIQRLGGRASMVWRKVEPNVTCAHV